MKHTPGPWKIGAIESGRYAVDGANDEEVTGWIDEGDALLIAAAPELYAALEEAVDKIKSQLILLKCDGEFIEREIAKARAALQKARGEL